VTELALLNYIDPRGHCTDILMLNALWGCSESRFSSLLARQPGVPSHSWSPTEGCSHLPPEVCDEDLPSIAYIKDFDGPVRGAGG
jgi:hypothetical protein